VSEVAFPRKSEISAARLKIYLVQSILPVVMVLTCIGFGMAEEKFYSLSNLLNISKQTSYMAMLATAQMLVLLTRGFDLSVGNVISMISVLSASAMVWVLKGDPGATGLAIFTGWMVGIGVGLLAGAMNGFNIAILRVNSFVATLGMMGITLGIASTYTGGSCSRPSYASVYNARPLPLPPGG
jgi:ribose transport system permease protein